MNLRERLQAALVDRYRLERELGRGGMATVFLAHDLRHKRPVALKVLHPELAQTLGPERFHREIETVARLQHPHILAVHDSGEVHPERSEGLSQLWFTMPYVEGESLRERLNRERQLPMEDALRIATDAARALQYAHDHGVIHRDIKPENLLLTTDGSTLVADFGIARELSAGDERLTETGISVGTPAYMSPEQGAGDRALDARTDVYSLGAVLYEMLAGEPPFTGPTAQAIIAKRLSGEVPHLHHARPSIPESLEQAVTRALAPIAADRFTSVAEFARAIQAPPGLAAGSTTGSSVQFQRMRRQLPLAAIALLLGLLVGLGVLFAWRRSRGDGDDVADGAKRLAVLPFENLGDAGDAYFAEGVANDVRTKLTQISGLAVIARESSSEYRQTRKPPLQIARELGVDYLLTATVQWEKAPGGASRVRVTPELVDLRRGRAPETRWGQSFDAAMTGVFQVQADIAEQVARALNVALGDSTKRGLSAAPTQNLPAYEAFLQGEAAAARAVPTAVSAPGVALDPASLRQAVAAYEQAVALDSSFIQAWARLAQVEAALYIGGASEPARLEAVRRAAQRALALAPMRPEGHQALGAYYSHVLADNSRAYIEDSTALALAPGNAELLTAVGFDELTLGRWNAARGHLEQAARLDPRSGATADQLGQLYLYTRDYPRAEQAFNRAVQLLPANLIARLDLATVALAQGDLARARVTLNGAPDEVSPTRLVAVAANYLELYWLLDEGQQQLLLRLTPGAFDNERTIWAMVLAQTYAVRGNLAKARAYADSGRAAYEESLRATPADAQGHAFLGLAYAYLGRKAVAIRQGQHAVALLPTRRDAYVGPYLEHQLARIYLLVGEPDKALDQLELVLKAPYYVSGDWLKIDPNFAPLRGNPRFERLVAGPS